MTTVGIVGLGEAGMALAVGLRTEAGADVVGTDLRAGDTAVRAAAEAGGVRLVADAESVAEFAEVVICMTSAAAAIPVARTIAPALSARHVYADYNSASPRIERTVAAVVEATGARFVDGAVMAAVPPSRHRVPVLASGSGAAAFAAFAERLGMQVDVLGDRAGQASAVKMFRSLLVKGIEALVLECAVGAASYDAAERVFSSMNGSLPFEDWNALASYLVGRTIRHGARRAEELRQVAATLSDAGVEPMLAEAGARRLQWAADLRLAERFEGAVPTHYQDVLAALGEEASGQGRAAQRGG